MAESLAKNIKRGNSGFTMMETLVVVAIIAIMGGLVVMSLFNTQKSMYQIEMDGKAKEIYIAAQNHLTTAKSEGILDRVTQGAAEDATEGIYYYITPADKDNFSNKANALYQMLPVGSIDDSVRLGGSYIIRYQVKGEIARVLDVFYAEPNGQFPITFTSADYSAGIVSNYGGDENADNRREYPKKGGSGIIGWWGDTAAALVNLPTETLEAPTIQVINAERLRVIVTDTNVDTQTESGWWDLRLEVVGQISGATMTIRLKGYGANVASGGPFGGGATGRVFTVDLDDVTSTGYRDSSTDSGHFADIAKYYLDGKPKFIPGEDISIQAIASTTKRLAGDAKSATVITNSLFDSLAGPSEPAAPPATGEVASGAEHEVIISSIRHLENLDPSISEFNVESLVESAAEISSITTAEQVENLSWTRFLAAIRSEAVQETPSGEDDDGLVTSALEDTEHPVIVTKVGVAPSNDNAANLQTVANTFMPVNPGFALNYKGNSLQVSDIEVDTTGPAGMFGSLNGGSVQNLELLDFKVTTSSGNAGALAGETTSTAILGVLARNDPAISDSGLQISGISSVGGLVGAMDGGSIDSSAAALYVSSSNGDAGGLVGSVVSDAGNATISKSYSGGHTTGGSYSSGTTGVGRMNVQAASAAGGLIGNMGGTSITSCYSTCSASGSTAGGLVGSNSANITDCYATGLVVGTTKGAFAGSRSGGVLSGNHYIGIINYDISKTEEKDRQLSSVGGNSNPAGISPVDKVTPADKDKDEYKNFTDEATGAAVCYDSTLSARYTVNGAVKYPYPCIVDLASSASDAQLTIHLSTHFGDWPSPGELVINN